LNNERARPWGAAAFAALIIGLLAAPRGAAAPVPGTQTEGTLTAVDAGTMTLATGAGNQIRVALTGETLVIQRKPVTLQDIKPNDFVGVTARREPDGSLTALSINIFPPEFRGRVREAQFVMDTGNVMTNATVFQNVRRVEGRTLYLRLPDGTAVIAVPKDAQVIRLTLITAGQLTPGMRVLVRGTAGSDGTIVATTITVDAGN